MCRHFRIYCTAAIVQVLWMSGRLDVHFARECVRRWRIAKDCYPSPSGRGCPEGAGEGTHSREISHSTSLSFSARLPGGRVAFSCVAKRKSPKRRPPREHALRPSMDCGFARGRRGSPTVHPCTCGELARIVRAILWTFPSPARNARGAPPARFLRTAGTR